jgi:hypothetical protein
MVSCKANAQLCHGYNQLISITPRMMVLAGPKGDELTALFVLPRNVI